MSPLRESFGEEWVEEEEEEMEKSEDMICKEASIGSSQASGFESKEDNSLGFECKKNKFLVEMQFEITEVCDISKGQIEGDCLEMDNSNEHYLELECLKHAIQEKVALPSCLGWASGDGKRVPMLKRVMSEASFMRGQVMVSKSESIQVVMSKRESSMMKEGTFTKDWGSEETKITREDREKGKEMVDNKNEKKREKDGSEEVVGAHQVPSMLCATPLEAVHTHPCTSKEVHMHPTSSTTVCIESKAWKDSKKLPMSKGFKTLKEVHMPSEAAQVHPEVTSKALKEVHMASMETQMHSKTKETVDRRVKALEEVHMPIEKSKATQMHTKVMEAVASCQVKDLEGAQMQLTKSKAHSNVKKAGSGGRVKALEVVHMGEKSPQREQGEGVGKQASGRQLEVKEVNCECCGMGEECSIGYIEHVKGVFSGHWVCGLCAEAVNEEKHRLGRGVPMEEALRTHMNLCKQFSSKKKAGEPPNGIGVAHAVCHLLSRHLSDPPTSPRQIAPVRPLLSRTASCLPSFSHNTS